MTKVLIVDDHEIVRRGLKQILTDEFPQLQVGEAGDARQAVEAAHKQAWDIVLLDINMPGRSGLEVLEDLRKLRPDMPVVVLSAFPETDFALRSLKLGACGYVNKQSASDELLAAIRKVLSGGRYITPALAETLAASLAGDFASAPHETLSNRELQVLRLIATGRTIKDIATQLSLSEKTVGTYRTRISDKMGLATNVELTRYALQHKLVVETVPGDEPSLVRCFPDRVVGLSRQKLKAFPIWPIPASGRMLRVWEVRAVQGLEQRLDCLGLG